MNTDNSIRIEDKELTSFISDLSLYTRFDKDRIKAYQTGLDKYLIVIDDIEWFECSSVIRAKAELKAIFKGIKLARGLI